MYYELLSKNNVFADRVANGREFLLVFRHDIAFHQCRITVQIVGDPLRLPAGGFQFAKLNDTVFMLQNRIEDGCLS